MYAVIKTGGKQYRVEPGATLEVERLVGDVGSDITLDEVLMVANGDTIVDSYDALSSQETYTGSQGTSSI